MHDNTCYTNLPSIPFLLFLLISAIHHSQSLSQRHPHNISTDQNTLLSFKSHITNDPFSILSTWNPNTSCCQWKGVRCNPNKTHITGLLLSNLSLSATISPSITNLSFLTILHLQNNSFHGQLPQELGFLFRLHVLVLASNLFTGPIPSSLRFCSRLRVLDFSRNGFYGTIPPELGLLSKLQDLSFGENHLMGLIPASFGNLSSLNNLILLSNNLQRFIPVELGRLNRLLKLQLGDNDLQGEIPDSLFNVSSLISLSLAKNRLLGRLPYDMFDKLPNLNTFFVGGNLLEGLIPSSLSNASNLERVDFSTNGFSGQIPILGNLPNILILNFEINQLVSDGEDGLNFLTSLTNSTLLQVFSVATNRLTGRLPSSIGNLSSQLSLLVLGENGWEGNIPEEIGNLGSLAMLELASSSFTGQIPSSIGKLQNLQNLYLDSNYLSGPIPESLGNLTQLFELGLSKNNLTGIIPLSLENCNHLQILDVSLNSLHGVIPVEVLGYPSLRLLNLSWNSLNGSLPFEIGNLKTVQQIDISKNQLSGIIPSTIGECSNLLFLSLAGNSLLGPIPNSLGNLKGIEYIDLSSNKLSGKIPSFMNSLLFLQFLNLSSNQLEGEVPKRGIFANSTEISLTGNSKICGGVPQLKLPRCTAPEKTFRRSKAKLIVGLVIGLMAFCILMGFLLLFWKRKPREHPTADVVSFDGPHRLYSYHNLKTATRNFSTENLIGEGSFGSVYKGVLNDGTPAAIKVFNMEQQGAAKSFIAECEALRNVRHRNLVRIKSVCSTSDFKALVLEFMPNGSLEKWLYQKGDSEGEERRTLNLRERLAIATDIASAMEYLHHDCETPVVHCDLKPSNVLLDEDKTAHVGDFGLARMLFQTPFNRHFSSTLGLKGSIGYIAPEYGFGGVSTKGDVYSYGILLLEMFTGKKPTDEIFISGLNLQKWVATALPDRVVEILDVDMMEDYRNWGEDCLVSVMSIGLLCAIETPEERPNMRDVSARIKSTRNKLFNIAN